MIHSWAKPTATLCPSHPIKDANSLSSSVADAVHTLLAEFSLSRCLLPAEEEGEEEKVRSKDTAMFMIGV